MPRLVTAWVLAMASGAAAPPIWTANGFMSLGVKPGVSELETFSAITRWRSDR